MSARTPTTAPIIRPEEAAFLAENSDRVDLGSLTWQDIAGTLAAEVTRLRAEVDRLAKLGGTPVNLPIASKADWTHPLFPLWVELGLDNMPGLLKAWEAVQTMHCPKCNADMESFMDGNACRDCGLMWILYTAGKHGSFAIDTIERAQERGPDE